MNLIHTTVICQGLQLRRILDYSSSKCKKLIYHLKIVLTTIQIMEDSNRKPKFTEPNIGGEQLFCHM